MRILIAHNEYQQPGGEDTVAAAEARLLESYGHSVIRYRRHNDELNRRGALGIAAAGLETVWSQRSARELRTLIRNEQPDVAHFHNTFPLISPAAYAACAGAGVPVVQTLHNYRLLCPSAIFFREGRTCTECLGRTPAWPGVAHACYRNNRAATTAVAAMLATHRILGTWSEKVDVYVALSEFARRLFIQGGLPAERIVVKPNFVQHTLAAADEPGGYVLFIGRFCEEKGVRTLLDAWRKLKQPIPLRIAGDGPLREEMAETIHRYGLSHVTLTERADPEEIKQLLRGSRFLVFPSLWFEGFPLSIAEAMATGRAVIASRLGSMMEIIEDGLTGLHFAAGDALDLARKVEWAWNNQDGIRRLGRNARDQFERNYTAERNYQTLMRIYERAASTHRAPAVAKTHRPVPALSLKRKEDA